MEICFLRFGLPSSWACEKGHQKRIFSKTLSRVEIFENAVFPQSWGWVKHEEVFENDYVTGSDTSKCPRPNKSHYCAFVWTGKNDPKTQRVDADFLKTWCRRDDVSRYFWKRGFCLRFSTPSTQCYRNYTVLFKSVKCATCGRVFPWKRRKNSRFSKIPWYVWTQGLRENLCCCNSCYTVGSLSNDVSEQRTSTEVDFLHSSAVILNKFLGKTSLQEFRLLAIQTC